MATTTYESSFGKRLFNGLMKAAIRLGIGPKDTWVLSVPGRKTGKVHSTPVTLVEEGGKRWLVAPYGPVDWVKNARVAGKVGLRRGKHAEIVPIRELGPEEAAPVLKMYVERVPHPRPYFDNDPDAPPEAFIAEAHRHPVFLIG
ncbi:MAG TPA: nitroreductase/quinone reductase family protein [Thermomicrobiales bacterium]|nr:nitroreductase/quinone reductase family protein [Thermomicrobiales bacterium]